MEFNKAYNRRDFIQFLEGKFLPEDYKVEEELVPISKTKYTSKITNLGYCKSLNLVVYEIEHISKHDARVGLSKEAFRFLANEWDDKALVAFVPQDDKSNYRFSLITVDLDENSKGQEVKVYSNPRRYSYILGECLGDKIRTPKDYLEVKGRVKDEKDLQKRFNVEALTKQFYKDLFNWYQWALDEKTGVTFPNNTFVEDDDREQLDTKIIRLITRLIFVWFIKQKNLIQDKFFDVNKLTDILKDFDPQSTTSGTYYNAILQNLFFATLNRAIIDEEGNCRAFAKSPTKDVKTLYRYKELFNGSEKEVIDFFSEVPFLNGGLFECLDKTKTIDGVEKAYNYDGFSRNDKTFADGHYRNRAFVPNILFFEPENGLLSILKRYNFTVEENTPQDQQIALDPELLGKVFENLLGIYNPETRETARKESGSFYTPREIVNYMVDESLIAYLGDTPLVRSLFKDDFKPDEFYWPEYQSIIGKLKSIKILDPACGSGAFPMGLLNRIVDILKKIETEKSSYELKLNLIENCIYGVDKQSIAIQISKLRFFISLICDCKRNTDKPNFGIPTLPNLETKFVAADSLIGLKKQTGQLELVDIELERKIKEKKNELRKIRHQHFLAKTAYQKIKLRKQDEIVRAELAELLKEDDFYIPEDAKQLIEWNPYDQNEVSNFFDPEWMFNVSDGFDIIIGNPPYIQLQNNNGELAKLYGNCNYKTFARTGDIYCLFYERGWQLLKQGGHLCFITSNKWMRAGYGEKTRQFLASHTNPISLLDFAGVRVFESATVDTNILLFSKSKNSLKTMCTMLHKQNENCIRNLSVYVQQQHSICDFSGKESWVVLSPIEQSIKRKIEAVGTPLKDWDIKINYGIKTGCNEAFIISTEKRDEILANCKTENERQRTDELIRPILRGRDIKRYGYNWDNKWLIATFPSRHYNIDDYPTIKDYFLSFGIERLEQTGKMHIINGEKVKSRKKTNNKWYETQDSISYMDDFNKPKIIYIEIMTDNEADGYLFPCFSFDNKRFFVLNTGYILTSDTINVTYIVAILNSKLGRHLVKLFVSQLQKRQFRMLAQYVSNFPIPIINNNIQKKIIDLVNKIILSNDSDIQIINEYEDEINILTYNLYGLSSSEIEFIENDG